MLGLPRQQFQHVIANPGPDTEDPLEFGNRGTVDGQPPVLEVGNLDEGIGPLDDVGEQFALGQGFRDPAFERLVEIAQEPRFTLAQGAFGQHVPGRLEHRAEHPGDTAALVANRRVGEGEPGLLVVPLRFIDQREIFP